MENPVSRERAAIALLDEWPWKLGGTLIGGYAVAAYGAPRYSVDVDIVIPSVARAAVRGWLTERGFGDPKKGQTKTRRVFEDALRYSRDEVNVDILVGYVQDREAGVRIPESWISSHPQLEQLDLITGRLERKVPVARLEAMWALKLQAGRDQDLTDLFSFVDRSVDPQEIRSLFENLMVPSLQSKLKRVEQRLTSRKLFDDSRSRMGIKSGVDVSAKWRKFQELVTSMIPPGGTSEPPP